MTGRLIIAATLLAACSAAAGYKIRDWRDVRSCRYLAGELSSYSGFINQLPSLRTGIPPDVIASIYRCWAANPGSTLGRQLRLSDARQLTASSYLLAFGIWGVSDRSVLFEVDGAGHVRRAYGYPYTL